LNEAQFFNIEDKGDTLVACSLSQDIPLKQNTKEGCFMIAEEQEMIPCIFYIKTPSLISARGLKIK